MADDGDLYINPELTIPVGELEWTFTTTGGPGGQHANRNRTRAEVSWQIDTSRTLTDAQRRRLSAALGSRVSAIGSESRSQWRNRRLARRRLIDRVQVALREQPKRLPTEPSRQSQNRRLEEKRRRSEVKRMRRPPEFD